MACAPDIDELAEQLEPSAAHARVTVGHLTISVFEVEDFAWKCTIWNDETRTSELRNLPHGVHTPQAALEAVCAMLRQEFAE